MPDDDDATREAVHEPEPPADEVAAALLERFPGSVFADSHGQAVVYVGVDDWHDVAMFLRDDQRFTQCVDLAAVDHLIDEDRIVPPGVSAERYEVVANFLSHPRNRRIRTICQLPATAPEVATARRPLSRYRLPRARDVRPVRHQLHRPRRPRAHPDARRLGRPPVAQGRLALRESPSPSKKIRVPDERATRR